MTDHTAGASTPVAARGGAVFGWYNELSTKERRTFWACFTGWALDAMDVQLYSFVIATITALWAISRADAGLLATATLLASSVGGWLVGILADRFGRVRMLQITILWFSVFTFLCAFANSYEQLFIFRALQGFGFGGEYAAGAVLIGEIIRNEHRGKGNGVVHAGWAVGWGVAAIGYTVFFSVLPETIAWRALFAIGILPAVAVFFVRRFVDEPALFVENQRRYTSGQEARPNFLEIFSPALLRTTILASILTIGTQGGYYAIMIWLPTYLKTVRGFSVLGTGGYLAVIIVASFLGYVISAYLTDILGRRMNFLLFAICSVATVLAYMFLPISDSVLFFLGAPLGFFASGIYSGIGAFFNELYPTRVRGSGIGFCFNVGRALGALFPALVGYISATMPLGQAIGIFTVAAYGLIIVSALLLPETKGRSLA
ncbi:MAG TPA: MFS transporter [Pseudolabrys sp.]|jgi:MFS family permease